MNSHLLRRIVLETSDSPEYEASDEELAEIVRIQRPRADEKQQSADVASLRQAEKIHASQQRQPRQKLEALKNPDMSWHDHLIMLLQVAAGIEHALMVQYLYSAYSMGGQQVPEAYRKKVGKWRDSMISAAKEEMGHMLTVQNILTFVGGPINLDRDDFPWDAKYYPFPFVLEPFTLQSLSCYVYAEMPDEDEIKAQLKIKKIPRYERFIKKDRIEIEKRVKKITHRPHQVGVLYDQIIKTIEDAIKIPESYFQPDSVKFQAASDEWGRGYELNPSPPPPGNAAQGRAQNAPRKGVRSELDAYVKIARIATRAQAVEALKEISTQGEGPHLGTDDAPSHFDRFLKIYQQYCAIGQGWDPARSVPRDPTTLDDPDAGNCGAYIEAEISRNWAYLFNLRYRLLLTYLAHTFRLARVPHGDEPNVRAMIMHRVFGEMYNLKTIARILVGLPFSDVIKDKASDPDFAGPPFEMPYSLRLPPADADCWALYGEILITSGCLCGDLLEKRNKLDPRHVEYVEALLDLDQHSRGWIEQLRAGLTSGQKG